MARQHELARRFFDRFEPVHAVTYFAPEARAALDALGYRGFWMGYFAARSAPLGVVPPEVVTAIFYNFAPERVAKALPAAWRVAGPAEALRARAASAVAALRRCGLSDDNDDVRVAPDWPRRRRAARLRTAGRCSPPTRRCRGPTSRWPRCGTPPPCCANIVGTATSPCSPRTGSGRESNVLHAAAGQVERDYIARTRHYDEASWSAHQRRLAARGILDADGALTTAGRALKDRIEDTTDALALSALGALDDDEVEALFRALTPLTRLVVAAGDIPATTPMGLRRHDLDDASAHVA